MKKIKILLIVYYSLINSSLADDIIVPNMEKYMVNCVKDYFVYSKDKKMTEKLDNEDVVYECGLQHQNIKPLFYYYQGKIWTKPIR